MSQQQAKAVVDKLKTDVAFRAKVMAEADVAERLKIINAAGFNCTVQELKAASQELDDDELNGVAGGWCIVHGISCPELHVG